MTAAEICPHRLSIITGHYGTGKTEFAVNLALALAAGGERVMLADLDIVNPYFRSRECRELLEEAGLTARALELYGVFTGPQEHHVYPNGDEVYNVEFAYTCRDWSGALRCQPGEVEALRFFHPDDLPDGLSLGLRRRLPDWRAHRRGLGASRSDRPFPR